MTLLDEARLAWLFVFLLAVAAAFRAAGDDEWLGVVAGTALAAMSIYRFRRLFR